VRDYRLVLRLTGRQARVLEQVARDWGVPMSTAGWAIVAERLAQAQRSEPELGVEVSVKLARLVLREHRPEDRHAARWQPSERTED
jgi:hypothetical protein